MLSDPISRSKHRPASSRWICRTWRETALRGNGCFAGSNLHAGCYSWLLRAGARNNQPSSRCCAPGVKADESSSSRTRPLSKRTCPLIHHSRSCLCNDNFPLRASDGRSRVARLYRSATSAMLGNFQIIVRASLRRLKFVSTLGNPIRDTWTDSGASECIPKVFKRRFVATRSRSSRILRIPRKLPETRAGT